MQALLIEGNLILPKVLRLLHLPNIVVIGARANQQIVRSDGLGGRFGQLDHAQGVLVRARRLLLQHSQQRMIQAREFEQPNVRRDSEKRFRIPPATAE